MIYELLSTALLAYSMGAGNYKDEPKRATTTYPFLGTYSLSCNITNQGDYLILTSPMGNEARVDFSNYGVEYSANTSDGFGTLIATRSEPSANPYADIIIKLRANTDVNDERLNYSFAFMQEDKSYTLGNNTEISEFNIDYTPEIYLKFSWTSDQVVNSTFTLPIVYYVEYETFGTTEYNGRTWIKQNETFSKTFNAIYMDNTEPKLYAFWLESYMLARQVRFNSDIINANYVTGLDRLDASFGKQCSIHFTPTEDIELKVSATPYDPTWELTHDYNTGYNAGFQAGKTEGQQPVSWIKTTFDGIAGFFNIQVFPFVTLGFLCFAPLIVVAIVAILRIIKHD